MRGVALAAAVLALAACRASPGDPPGHVSEAAATPRSHRGDGSITAGAFGAGAMVGLIAGGPIGAALGGFAGALFGHASAGTDATTIVSAHSEAASADTDTDTSADGQAQGHVTLGKPIW